MKKLKNTYEQSLKNNQVLEIQLNTLDDFGRVQPPIVGVFEGMKFNGVCKSWTYTYFI